MPVTSLAEPKVSKHNNKLMHTKTLSLSGIFFALCFSAGLETGVAASLPKPVSLQCDSLVEPLGIDNQKPLLSWQLQDARWGAVQTAYQMSDSKQARSACFGTGGCMGQRAGAIWTVGQRPIRRWSAGTAEALLLAGQSLGHAWTPLSRERRQLVGNGLAYRKQLD